MPDPNVADNFDNFLLRMAIYVYRNTRVQNIVNNEKKHSRQRIVQKGREKELGS